MEDVDAKFFTGKTDGTGPEILKVWCDRYLFPVESKGM